MNSTLRRPELWMFFNWEKEGTYMEKAKYKPVLPSEVVTG
jgi:hypothetical protein